VREGAQRPLAISNTRLRINSVLNSVTRRGTFIGNSAGIAGELTWFNLAIITNSGSLILVLQALMYNGVNSTIDALRGKHDSMGSMAAGALTGAIFKSTGIFFLCGKAGSFSHLHSHFLVGIRPMVVAAMLGSSLAGIWSYVKNSV